MPTVLTSIGICESHLSSISEVSNIAEAEDGMHQLSALIQHHVAVFHVIAGHVECKRESQDLSHRLGSLQPIL